MSEIAREILPVSLEDEMRQSYLDYAMSVIVGRALPDVRDGLKPVHRRVLFAMRELGNDWNKAYKKSARIVGDVIGKYHPHGDTAVYDTMVRMAQPFSMRYLLVDGQGNFGSVDGDMPAAMRYTEVRMSRIAHELLADIDKETGDFTPNYDEAEQEPPVPPTRGPNPPANGPTRSAAGMRVVIELKRGEVTEIVLNNLYAQTPMETVFGINMVALQDGQPKLMSLKEMLEAFIRHRREIVTRRTIYDLAKARERAHILEGLAVALANIDAVIALIKAAASPPEARTALQARAWPPGVVTELLERAGAISTRPQELPAEVGLGGGAYRLSEAQAQAILDMRLHRLTGLEQDKIVAEYRELLESIRDLGDILARAERLTQ